MSDHNERITQAIMEVIAENIQTHIQDNEMEHIPIEVPMRQTNNTEGQCSICLEQFSDEQDIVQIPCEHKFHRTCIETWFETHTTCPICRRNYQSETVHRLEVRELITQNTFILHLEGQESITSYWSLDSTPLDLFLHLRRTIQFSQSQHKLVLIFNDIIFTCNESLDYLVQSWRFFGIIGSFNIQIKIF
tara:strand:- start:3729 stop:4298 length:570 start_codon:yes stop_codon:yes gene_type:complete